MKVNNDETAVRLFEFVAENSKVEWGHLKFGTRSNYISTSHKTSSEPGIGNLMGKLLKQNYTVREHIHSHPYKDKSSPTYGIHGPSGFGIGGDTSTQGDKALADWLRMHYPNRNVKTSVYDATLRKYIPYNSSGIINQ